ncbi:hypothetical protein Q1695_016303 [Nippostrongylus brasiliensis]|nr:hypothetical protein Q1695_016303 [Nippostrongylus brasiliensis]
MPSLMGHSYILSVSSLVLMRADLGEDKMHPAISTDVQVLERCQSRSFIVVGKPTETSGNRDAEDVALQQHQTKGSGSTHLGAKITPTLTPLAHLIIDYRTASTFAGRYRRCDRPRFVFLIEFTTSSRLCVKENLSTEIVIASYSPWRNHFENESGRFATELLHQQHLSIIVTIVVALVSDNDKKPVDGIDDG